MGRTRSCPPVRAPGRGVARRVDDQHGSPATTSRRRLVHHSRRLIGFLAGDERAGRRAFASERTADRVWSVAQRARSAGAPTASGPAGCSRRTAYQPPWVAASKASKGRSPEPRRAVVDGGVHPAPGVERGDGGVAAQRQGDAGVGQLGERVAAGRRARRRAARRTCRRRPPQAASKAGCTLATMPQVAHPRDVRPRRPSPGAPAGAGSARTAADAELGDHRADRVEHLAHGGVADAVEARLDAGARAGADVVDQLRRCRTAGRRWCRAGRCTGALSAAVCEPNAPSQNRSPPAPARPELADDVEPAPLGQLAPVAEHPRAGRSPRRARAARRGRRRRRPPGRPSRAGCRCPARRRRRRVARCAARRCVGAHRPEGGLPGGVVGVEPQPAVGGSPAARRCPARRSSSAVETVAEWTSTRAR